MAEGRKIIAEAMKSGYKIHTLMIRKKLRDNDPALLLLVEEAKKQNTQVYGVTQAILETISDTTTPQPVLAAIEIPKEMIRTEEDGLWIILDCIQDPGNMGTIIRNADAMGASGMIMSRDCADIYAPKTIRAAMGSTFHLPIVYCDALNREILQMREEGFKVIAADLRGKDNLPVNLGKRCAIMIGNEGNGLREELLECASLRYRLPMRGRAESLNAAVCSGIILYLCAERMQSANSL